MASHTQADSPFARIAGIWEGTLTRLDKDGNSLGTDTTRIVCRLEGDNGWYQQNTFTAPDGKVTQFEFGGTFDEQGCLVFDTGNMHGKAIPVTKDVIMLESELRNPVGRSWEMSNHAIPGERHRVSHRMLADGSIVTIQYFTEKKVSDG